MTFEEWWSTKDYPARCKGNCMEAFNAGLHADVHTDNSKVIAELEAQIEQLQKINNEQKETLKKVRVALIQERTANIMNYGKGGVEMFDSMFEI
jgi:hypothetical protein